MLDPDLKLLERWRSGDRVAGNELFQRYLRNVYRFFRSKLQGDVDELVQATFLACVRGRDRLREDGSFRGYLFAIARNELYGHLRRRRRERNIDFGVTSVADLQTTQRSRMVRQERHSRLLEALQLLPIEQQVMLELYYWEDLSVAELAAVFDTPTSTMTSRLHRARQALRSKVEVLSRDGMAGRLGEGSEEQPSGSHDEEFEAWARSVRRHVPDLDDPPDRGSSGS